MCMLTGLSIYCDTTVQAYIACAALITYALGYHAWDVCRTLRARR